MQQSLLTFGSLPLPFLTWLWPPTAFAVHLLLYIVPPVFLAALELWHGQWTSGCTPATQHSHASITNIRIPYIHTYIRFLCHSSTLTPDDLCTITVASKPAPGWAAPVTSCCHMWIIIITYIPTYVHTYMHCSVEILQVCTYVCKYVCMYTLICYQYWSKESMHSTQLQTYLHTYICNTAHCMYVCCTWVKCWPKNGACW